MRKPLTKKMHSMVCQLDLVAKREVTSHWISLAVMSVAKKMAANTPVVNVSCFYIHRHLHSVVQILPAGGFCLFFVLKGQSVFYCSVECQKAGWKLGGHKLECATFAKYCKDTGREVVSQMNDSNLSPLERVQNLERLDAEGPYNSAVEQGLHDAICNMFEEDANQVLDRFQSGTIMEQTAYIRWILNVLWRGNRISRQHCSTTRKCDGSRVSRYMKSSPEAFESFWRALCTTTVVPLDSIVFERSPRMHREVHQLARDVIASLSQLLTSSQASKSMLLLSKRMDGNDSSFEERLNFIAEHIEKNLRCLDKTPDGRDVRDIIEAYHYQSIAMIVYRMREFNISEDQIEAFEKKMRMNNINHSMYEQMSTPMAEATIKKGAALTNQETALAIQNSQKKSESKRKGKKKQNGSKK